MVDIKFNQQVGIFEFRLVGNISLNELLECINFRNENTTYPRSLKMMIDATNANFTFEIDDLDIIAFENLKSLEKYDYIFDAIILDTPKNTALSILYKQLAKVINYEFVYFSTKKCAIKWLNAV